MCAAVQCSLLKHFYLFIRFFFLSVSFFRFIPFTHTHVILELLYSCFRCPRVRELRSPKSFSRFSIFRMKDTRDTTERERRNISLFSLKTHFSLHFVIRFFVYRAFYFPVGLDFICFGDVLLCFSLITRIFNLQRECVTETAKERQSSEKETKMRTRRKGERERVKEKEKKKTRQKWLLCNRRKLECQSKN